MAKERQQEKKEIKVTDKRIFTPEGEIREEFRGEIEPADAPAAPPPPAPEKPKASEKPPATERRGADPAAQRHVDPKDDRRRTLRDKAESPGTPFANFIEPLIAQAYMSLGMLRNPYQPQAKLDVGAARQMIDILQLLQEKTAGNLTPDEDDFLSTHLSDLKLAFVQRTKSL